MNLQTIQTFHNSTEANLWKSRLENEGFLCFLYDEHLTSLYPGSNALLAGGIKLKVRVEDIDKVKEVFPGLLLTGTEELVFCPNCHSSEVEKLSKSKFFGILFDAVKSFADLLFPKLIKQNYHCQNCQTKFKA